MGAKSGAKSVDTVHGYQDVSRGSFVVVDPTGRDLLDCCEVGLVLEICEGEDGPEYVVAINGTNQILTCTVITAVLS